MTNTEIKQRGLDAAKAFVTRIGMTYLKSVSEDSTLADAFYALDGDQLVLVYVSTRRRVGGPDPQPSRGSLKSAKLQGIRLDMIQLTVIAQDRALLRHHRGVWTPELEEVPA